MTRAPSWKVAVGLVVAAAGIGWAMGYAAGHVGGLW